MWACELTTNERNVIEEALKDWVTKKSEGLGPRTTLDVTKPEVQRLMCATDLLNDLKRTSR